MQYSSFLHYDFPSTCKGPKVRRLSYTIIMCHVKIVPYFMSGYCSNACERMTSIVVDWKWWSRSAHSTKVCSSQNTVSKIYASAWNWKTIIFINCLNLIATHVISIKLSWGTLSRFLLTYNVKSLKSLPESGWMLNMSAMVKVTECVRITLMFSGWYNCYNVITNSQIHSKNPNWPC